MNMQEIFLENILKYFNINDSKQNFLKENIIHYDRLYTYVNGYIHCHEEILDMTFPTVKEILGDELFFNLATEYAKQNSCDHYDIGHLADNFSNFLKNKTNFEFIYHLADFERLIDYLWYKKHEPPLKIVSFYNSLKLAPTNAKLIFNDDFRLYTYPFNIAEIYLNPMNKPMPTRCFGYFYRNNWENCFQEIDNMEYFFLKNLQKNCNFYQTCLLFEKKFPIESKSISMDDWFQRWFSNEIFQLQR